MKSSAAAGIRSVLPERLPFSSPRVDSFSFLLSDLASALLIILRDVFTECRQLVSCFKIEM